MCRLSSHSLAHSSPPAHRIALARCTRSHALATGGRILRPRTHFKRMRPGDSLENIIVSNNTFYTMFCFCGTSALIDKIAHFQRNNYVH